MRQRAPQSIARPFPLGGVVRVSRADCGGNLDGDNDDKAGRVEDLASWCYRRRLPGTTPHTTKRVVIFLLLLFALEIIVAVTRPHPPPHDRPLSDLWIASIRGGSTARPHLRPCPACPRRWS